MSLRPLFFDYSAPAFEWDQSQDRGEIAPALRKAPTFSVLDEAVKMKGNLQKPFFFLAQLHNDYFSDGITSYGFFYSAAKVSFFQSKHYIRLFCQFIGVKWKLFWYCQ